VTKTLSGLYANGYVLALAQASTLDPVTVTGTIQFGTTTLPSALYGQTGEFWTVTNAGSIAGSTGAGIELTSGGIVTNLAGATVTGLVGVSILGLSGSVVNAGAITAPGTSTLATGVYLQLGGGIDNQAGGLITGDTAVYIYGGAGTVHNAGTIAASAQTGVFMISGGAVTNDAAGQISGTWAIAIERGPGTAALDGTVVNHGTLTGGSQDGVYLAGGTVTNYADGLITGTWGVVSQQAAALLNAGTITGTASSGVYLSAGTVTNQSTGRIAGDFGVTINTAGGQVINAGTIAGVAQSGIGVVGGAVTNSAGGSISGAWGISIETTAGSVVNDGHISGPSQSGIYLVAGSVTNNAGGRIDGGWAVAIHGAGSVLNAGTLAATTQSGIYIGAGGTITNLAGGTISGTTGIDLRAAAGTVDTAGSIAGSGGTAVSFAPGYANLLKVHPGAAFSGLVDGGNTIGAPIASALEFAAGSGTLAGLGTTLVDFSGITLDPGAAWTLRGTPAGFAGPISGFATGDTIELAGLTGSISGFAGGTLSLQSSAGPLALAFAGNIPAQGFTFANSSGGLDITLAPPCFRAGTQIATDRGPVAVEHLQAGDRVRLARSAATADIAWLGHRQVNCRRHPDPRAVWPVRILAGAFAPGRPRRDLFLSPDHAVFIDGVLVPIRYLVNGATIAQVETDSVTYWHVELASHDVILAEDLPCESYLDTGNRASFANGGSSIALQPDFALRIWEQAGCAPLVRGGEAVAAIFATLLARAKHLGFRLTDDPMLHMSAGPRRVFPTITGIRHHFRVPPGTHRITLKSRSAIPLHLGRANDPRRLGIAITRLHGNGHPIALTDPRLLQGWHSPEHDGATRTWRWTNGTATLDATGLTDLTLDVAYTEHYWREPDPMSRRRA